MRSTTRPTTPTMLLATIALLALLLSLLGGTAAVATDDDHADEPACELDDAPDETDASSDTDEGCEDGDEDDGSAYTDVPADLPHVEGISWLESTGVTKGCKAGRFCPNKPVTRAEFATFAARMLGEVDDVEPVAAPAEELQALRDRVTDLEEMVTALESRLADLE